MPTAGHRSTVSSSPEEGQDEDEEDTDNCGDKCCCECCRRCDADTIRIWARREHNLLRRFSKKLPCLSAWAALLIGSTTYFIFICPHVFFQLPFYLHAFHSIAVLFSISSFLITTFIDPGFFKRAPSEEHEYDDIRTPLYKAVDIKGILVRMKWCSTCQFYRPPRCSHCSSCDACVENFDHHCPWINNCVGKRNYRFFITFLLSTTIHMIISFICCVYLTAINFRRLRYQPNAIISSCLIILIIVLIVPVGGLSGFHLVLISRARTTNEQVTGKFKANVNPFTTNVFHNYIQTFCSSITPSRIRWHSKFMHTRRSVTNRHLYDDMQLESYHYMANNFVSKTKSSNHYEPFSKCKLNQHLPTIRSTNAKLVVQPHNRSVLLPSKRLVSNGWINQSTLNNAVIYKNSRFPSSAARLLYYGKYHPYGVGSNPSSGSFRLRPQVYISGMSRTTTIPEDERLKLLVNRN